MDVPNILSKTAHVLLSGLVELKQPMGKLGESNHVLRCSVETPIIRSLFGAVCKNRHDLQYVKSVHQIPSVKTDSGLSRNDPGSTGNASFLPHAQDPDIQGGSNMTGTDLYVKKPHCAAAVRP